MTRPLRLEFPNALYHITSRGDRREDIYEDAEDRLIFLTLLGKVVADFNWLCHGYCLMTNHYHLIVETLEGNLSKGMRQLNGERLGSGLVICIKSCLCKHVFAKYKT
ncbi:transposase [Methylicorpusculum oleiharenae]|uniref:transposase n=1 Tax=Methylicorpusculum oleiharenae TaxID=1338687 RepID=UPI0019D2CECA|nr:transposase [Methylicorpusculum oleiharenae]MCD2450167.1 transposase [Methylicorpusculum oleiharenae]